MKTKKLAVLALIAALVVVFFAADLGRYLSLEYLRQSQQALADGYASNPWLARGAFFAVYVAVAALSLPGAAVLTLAGGAVMGFGWGLLLVSFASSIGATLAFLSARYLLRDTVTQRMAERMAGINAGLARDGAWYLLSLRLIPAIPFFVINLAMGLTTLGARTFYTVSQFGMLPGTAVYVLAGTQLAQLRSLSDVLSPSMLGAFVLLGLFPLAAKAVLGWLQQRKKLAPWAAQRPRHFDRNLIVIGGGAAGLVSASIGAAL